MSARSKGVAFATLTTLDRLAALSTRIARMEQERDALLLGLVAELHQAGCGVRQIARHTGLSPATISRRLRGVKQ